MSRQTNGTECPETDSNTCGNLLYDKGAPQTSKVRFYFKKLSWANWIARKKHKIGYTPYTIYAQNKVITQEKILNTGWH